MFVGHAALAFGAAALVARGFGRSRRDALALGVVAGLFATVPDVDMVYAVVGLVSVGLADVWTMTGAFWGHSTVVHRAITHSLVFAVPAAAAFTLWPTRRVLALAVLAGLVAVSFAVSGVLGAAVMLAFAAAGVLVSEAAAWFTGADGRALFGASLLGLASHPFGDVFTGSPPQFLYPFDATLLAARVAPFPEPTLNLLTAFGAELAAIWFGVLVFAWLTERDPFAHVNPRAVAGVAYVVAVPFVPAPTFDVSYQFVFSVLSVGFVGAMPQVDLDLPDAMTAVTTGLAAVTLAVVAYTAVFLAV
ncbi:metal-dependent hydrolase [Halobacteriaceae archaeon GCM10025711]